MTFRRAVSASLAVLFFLTSVLVTDMYKWIDEYGKEQYTESPQQGQH